MPVVTANLLDSIELLTTACDILHRHCIEGIEANEHKCRQYVENSTAAATALVSELGYEKSSQIAQQAKEQDKTIREIVTEQNLLTNKQFDMLISPEAVCRLGFKKQLKP